MPLYLSLAAAVLALGLAGWAWLVMSRIEDDLREFAGFEGLHFDI